MADVLVERETVDKEELEALLDGRWAEHLEEEKLRPKEEQGDPDKGKRKSSKGDMAEEAPASDDTSLLGVPVADVGEPAS